MPRYIIDTSVVLHNTISKYWGKKYKTAKKQSIQIFDRFVRLSDQLNTKTICKGDVLVTEIRDVFDNGLGIKWGDDQIRVFNAFLFSCLPLIYGNEWPENKARILEEWGKSRECPYTVVSMARRNGKTFVTSGTVVALLLVVPGIKVAIFSTCKRTSQMMMSAAVDMLENAFEIGTHCNRQDFIQIAKNTESIVYEGPDRTKRILGCYPGSVKVKFYKKKESAAAAKKVFVLFF
jgi:hypothetical protein